MVDDAVAVLGVGVAELGGTMTGRDNSNTLTPHPKTKLVLKREEWAQTLLMGSDGCGCAVGHYLKAIDAPRALYVGFALPLFYLYEDFKPAPTEIPRWLNFAFWTLANASDSKDEAKVIAEFAKQNIEVEYVGEYRTT